MKKITKILSFVFLLSILFSRICFADVIMPGEDPRSHGMGRYNDWNENTHVNYSRNNTSTNRNDAIEERETNFDTLKVLGIGVLVMIIVSCTVFIVVQIVKKGNNNNDNK